MKAFAFNKDTAYQAGALYAIVTLEKLAFAGSFDF